MTASGRFEAALIGEAADDVFAPPARSPVAPLGSVRDSVGQWAGFASDPFVLVTQNVDDLHAWAGSRHLITMHGTLRALRCERCDHLHEMLGPDHLLPDVGLACPRCAEDVPPAPVDELEGRGRSRPHVVWFLEMPLGLDLIERAVTSCDVFLVVGTSGVVHPAAGYVGVTRAHGATVIGIDLEAPEHVGLFDTPHPGAAGEVLPGLVDG